MNQQYDKHLRNLEMNKSEFPNFVAAGMHYGYPICCINDVCFRKRHGIPISPLQRQVCGRTGFFPCTDHAVAIKAGKIKLADVILPTRTCKSAFPVDENDLTPE